MVTQACAQHKDEPLRFPPVVVTSPLRLAPVVVSGGELRIAHGRYQRVRYGDPLPVLITQYCLRGTTRRGRYVRQGIVAADPHVFPLARYIELYVGTRYLGRFLVDDTGGRIKGRHIDLWTPDCRAARRFGLQHGTAVAVHAPQLQIRQTGAPTPRTAPGTGAAARKR
jgi:3D (Asp-Asp-Asp) domain-containing protein